MKNDTPDRGIARRDVVKWGLLGISGLLGSGLVSRGSLAAGQDFITITNARIFDGRWLLDADTVVIEAGTIAAVGRGLSARGKVIDARRGTLLPGLIDAHTHSSVPTLADALRFGVTTELEMGGYWDPAARRAAVANDSIADFRSSFHGVTPPNGHPAEMLPPGVKIPSADVITPRDARRHVARVIDQGADYVKILIEDGMVMGHPGLPELTTEAIEASVATAHERGKMAIAHALTIAATERAIAAGADGLAHVFVDRSHTPDIVRTIAASHAFVIPCLTLNKSLLGGNSAVLAGDPRVKSKLDPAWLQALSTSMNAWPKDKFSDVLATVSALHRAGVDILVGTDAARLLPKLGGVAHGASVHEELQLLVAAGLTQIEALRAATSVTANRFGLRDRGSIAAGLRADLVLVDGDPTRDISSSLSVSRVWKRGVELASSGT